MSLGYGRKPTHVQGEPANSTQKGNPGIKPGHDGNGITGIPIGDLLVTDGTLSLLCDSRGTVIHLM